ncbi:MAG: hypothetical protein ACE5HQ_05155 [Gemmatimonadota bacterium]
MTDVPDGRTVSLSDLVGRPLERALARLGAPAVDRRIGPDRWLRYARPGVEIRLRARSVGSHPRAEGEAQEERVAYWSAGFDKGFPTLRAAAEAVGVWPACAPDESAPPRSSLLRRCFPDPGSGAVYSLTALARDGLIVQLAAFDEAPDWIPRGRTGRLGE